MKYTLLIIPLLLAGCEETADLPAGVSTPPPLIVAAEQRNLTEIDRLLQTAGKVDVRDACQWTPLMKAALNGHTSSVQRLLNKGALIDLGDKGGYTALMLAASNDHADVVRLLLEYGANINRIETTNGWTALIWAAKRGHIESVQLLLEHGADPAIRDNNELTALDWANKTSQKAVADHLQRKRPIE